MSYFKTKKGQDKKKAVSCNKVFFVGEDKTTVIKSESTNENYINKMNLLNLINEMAVRLGIEDLKSYNPALFEDDFLSIPTWIFPGKKAEVSFRILFATWKRDAHVDELKVFSGQKAKPLQKFRELGFVADQAEGKSNYYRHKDFRKFVGWEYPTLENISHIKISPERRKLLLKNERDYFTLSRVSLEIDHRTPVSACKKLGIEPSVLTDVILESEDFNVNKDFQFITRSRNACKREVCAKCIAGKDIMLPDVALDLERYKGQYKRRWDYLNEETKSCVGCFYYDCETTQDEYLDVNKPNLKTLVEKALKKNRESEKSLQTVIDFWNISGN